MNASPENTSSSARTARPPQLIQSLVGGFNTVTSNIALILLPVGLDLLLWLGPRVRIQTLFAPALQEVLDFMRRYSAQEMRPMLESLEELWSIFLQRYNLLSMLNTFPVGLPSQMAGLMPEQTPLASAPPAVELSTGGQFLIGWLALTLAGFILGSLYFGLVARACTRVQGGDAECPDLSVRALPAVASAPGCALPIRQGSLAWQTLQVIALVLLLVVVVLVMLVPIMLFATLLVMVNPMLAQFAILLLSFSAVWLLIPLVFTAHGIFLCRHNVLTAMVNSARVVRGSITRTGLFLLSVVVLHQGLGVLWNSPPETSWMALISIFGRAFISTGLLAASFFYFRAGLTYQQALRRAALLRRA